MKLKPTNKNDKNKKKVINEEYVKKQIPDQVKIALGKFYIYSMVYVIFFSWIFPYFLIDHVSRISQILLMVVLCAFYVYIFIDVKKKKKRFTSTLFVILIVLVLISISISMIKMLV